MRDRRWWWAGLSVLLGACADDGGAPTTTAVACKPSLRTVVMVHGFLEGPDLWGPFADRFAANGYCPDDLRAFVWDPLHGDGAEAALDAFIDATLAANGETQVDLVGHAGGADLAYRYLADPARAAKVQAYVHLAGSPAAGPAGPADAPVPTANIYSPEDPVVTGADIPGAANLALGSEDHVEVATSDKAFDLTFQFLRGGAKPKTLDRADAPPGDTTTPRTVSGHARTYGENAPLAGATVECWPLVAATGARRDAAPAGTFTTDAEGRWGPLEAEAGVRYELVLRAATGRPVHHYREPFVASSALVDLYALPSGTSLLHVLFAGLAFDADHTVLIVRSATRSVQADRDALDVDGTALATPALAAAARSTTTFVVYDDKADGRSTGPIQSYGDLFETTIAGLDQVVRADATRSLAVAAGDRTLAVPAWPSEPDGLVFVTLDR